ncbi:MAG: glycoside hydrolase family 97 N-terminal domain-containing protein [Bacteroidota bacterium]|nr:glycoside hydrolase family 97 N-terminal domain-containing protein [Bacteroidota bacterium]
MSTLLRLSLFTLASGFVLIAHSQNAVLYSPDQKTTVVFKIDAQKKNSVFYSVSNNGEIILDESPLGFEFENQKALQSNLRIVSVQRKSINTFWKPVYGERKQYPDHYNEMVIQLEESIFPKGKFSITFRVYDEGVAFKYFIQTNKPVTISKELTGFQFDKDDTSWITHRAQAKYIKGSISKTGIGCECPYVLEMNPGKYIALGEAQLVDNPRMKFDRSEKDSLLLLADLDGNAVYDSSFSTPWRYLMIADSPGKLLENDYFILNLNAPNALKDVSWIKPGKVIREVTLTTAGGKACIDFAAKHHLQYIEFDAGWYGPENESSSDATAVHVDPARSPGPLDLQNIVNYGRSKNVGVILYVNQKALTKQLDTILPLYHSWGIKGIKYGFVDVGSRQATDWLHEAVRKTSKYKLMVDIHDEYRPTGYSRTYPNLLTQEGIRGDEESTDNHNVLITIFTRMIAGAGDQTNCYFTPRVDEKMGSHASQMAKSICIYSPWQFIYWYDRPENSPRAKKAEPVQQHLL